MPPRPRLLCLPPAGSGASLFRSWLNSQAEQMEIVPVLLPGREVRFRDPLPIDIESLADQLADELETFASGRYAFFGYSMGALLSYEIGRRWIDRGLRTPEHLFVLGCNAPDRLVLEREPFHTMDDPDFRQALQNLGGVPPEILDNDEAMSLFKPILRNDFRICETYRPATLRKKLICPIHAFLAEKDDFVRRDAVEAWSDFISGPLTIHWLPGKHMIEHETFRSLKDVVQDIWLPQTAKNSDLLFHFQ